MNLRIIAKHFYIVLANDNLSEQRKVVSTPPSNGHILINSIVFRYIVQVQILGVHLIVYLAIFFGLHRAAITHKIAHVVTQSIEMAVRVKEASPMINFFELINGLFQKELSSLDKLIIVIVAHIVISILK